MDDLASALANQPLRNATAPTDIELAGFRGKYLKLSVPTASTSTTATKASSRAGPPTAGRATATSRVPDRWIGSDSWTWTASALWSMPSICRRPPRRIAQSATRSWTQSSSSTDGSGQARRTGLPHSAQSRSAPGSKLLASPQQQFLSRGGFPPYPRAMEPGNPDAATFSPGATAEAAAKSLMPGSDQ